MLKITEICCMGTTGSYMTRPHCTSMIRHLLCSVSQVFSSIPISSSASAS